MFTETNVKKLLKYMLVILIACVSVTSCSKDDDEPDNNSNNSSIIGTWRSEFSAGYQEQTFNSNGKYFFKEKDYQSGDWYSSGTWSLSNSILTIISDGEQEVYTIISLTETRMVTRYEGRYVGEYDYYVSEDYDEWIRIN